MASLQEARLSFYSTSPEIQTLANAIVKREGGFENSSADAGGPTQYGISLLFARAERYTDAGGHERLTFDMNHDGRVDVTDIREITPEIAATIFVADFFVRVGLSAIPVCLQPAAFDTSVNGGPARAVRLLQQTVNQITHGSKLKVDGTIGAKTNLALHQLADQITPAELVNEFCNQRAADYEAIARSCPQDREFLEGWLHRANSFRLKETTHDQV